MSLLKNVSIAVLLLLNVYNSCFAQSNNNLKLWYTKPAQQFEEALPLGNGRLGVMVYGGIEKERLSLNEETLWSGGPLIPHENANAHTYLQPVRDALFAEDYKKADSLMRFMQGKYTESYAPLGNLNFQFTHKSNDALNYKRELDIQNAISKVNYNINGTTYQREYFVSHPAQLAFIKLTAKGNDKLNFTCSFNSLLMSKPGCTNKEILIKGHSPIHAEPNYMGNIPNAVVYDSVNGMRFLAQLKVHKKMVHSN